MPRNSLCPALLLCLVLFLPFASAAPDLPPDAPGQPRDDEPTPQAVQHSTLWGQHGELWDPNGRLPDFSRAGYHSGDRPLPTITPTKTVKQYGAKGDGVTDDTKAFQNAVAAGGPIGIPSGRYVITAAIDIVHSGTVLKGEGMGRSILYFPKSLEAIYGRSYNSANLSNYSFLHAFLRRWSNTIGQEIGIEELTLEFPPTTYAGHHKEPGYNAIELRNLRHSWIRNVEIKNFDIALNWSYNVQYCTATGVKLTGRGGHHGFRLDSWGDTVTAYNLVTNFLITNTSLHDFTVQMGDHHNVFANGAGLDLSFDHHSSPSTGLMANDNLFSNLNVGKGTRPWFSGGGVDKNHSGPRQTFWNLRKGDGTPLTVIPGFGWTSGKGPIAPLVTLVGFAYDQFERTAAKEWAEGIPPGNLAPPDLHAAQLAKRLGTATPPVANIAALPASVLINTPVAFDGSGSKLGSAGGTLAYSWDFGDAGKAAGAKVSHAYTAPGSYTVVLTVNDGKASDTAVATALVTSPQGEVVGGFPVVAVTASASSPAANGPQSTRDGRLDTYWAADGRGQWIQYDLGESRLVNQVGLAFYRGHLRKAFFAVDTSPDGLLWKNTFTGQSTGRTLDVQAFPFPEVAARYVRIIGQGNSENTWNSYTELRLDGQPVPEPEPEPEPGPIPVVGVTASVSGAGNEPERVRDGKPDTAWIGPEAGDWVTGDLGTVRPVARLDVTWIAGDTRWQKFAIQVSEDATLWQHVFLGKSSGTTAGAETVTFPQIPARYVRVIGLGNQESSEVGIAELVWYGTPEGM